MNRRRTPRPKWSFGLLCRWATTRRGSRRVSPRLARKATSRIVQSRCGRLRGGVTIAHPILLRHEADSNHRNLAEAENAEREQHAFSEAVGVQANAELVDAEPGPTGDDISADCQECQAAIFYQSVPAGMQNEC